MEYNYFKNDLLQKGVDILLLLRGCLDCIKDCIWLNHYFSLN